MGDKTGISWTGATWSPMTGCSKISPGCDNCYAETMARRLNKMGCKKYELEFAVQEHRDALNQPLRWKRPRSIFVCSMGDLFHKDVSSDFIDEVYAVMALSPQHNFQVLTKRPKRMLEHLGGVSWGEFCCRMNEASRRVHGGRGDFPVIMPTEKHGMVQGVTLPFGNIWHGVSVEGKSTVRRIETLSNLRGKKFISFEPLIEDVGKVNLSQIDVAIVGGESGPRSRYMDTRWAKSIFDQCNEAGVDFYLKQMGSRWASLTHSKSRKGSIPSEWPSWVKNNQLPWF